MLRIADTDLTDNLIDQDHTPSDHPPIDVNALIRQKSPELASRLQGWKLAILRWLVCEKRLNRELMHMPPMPPRAFPGWALEQLGVAMNFPPARNLPDETERPVFLANHPTGGLDGLTLLHGLLQHYRSVQVVVTDLLLTIPPLQSLVVPVDRYQSSRASVHTLNQAFAGDSALLIFPAGRTARRQNGVLTEFPWHSMPASLAVRYGRPLVPLHIAADNSWRFHSLAKIRQTLNISLNLEMTLLVREMLKPATRHYKIYQGPVLTPEAVRSHGDTNTERMGWVRSLYDELASRTPHP